MKTCKNCIHNETVKTSSCSFCLCSMAFEMKEKWRHHPEIKCDFFKDKNLFVSANKCSNWISVKERLPDKEFSEYKKKYNDSYMEVIVMVWDGETSTVLLYDGKNFCDYNENICDVTHWMPMPEPPMKN